MCKYYLLLNQPAISNHLNCLCIYVFVFFFTAKRHENLLSYWHSWGKWTIFLFFSFKHHFVCWREIDPSHRKEVTTRKPNLKPALTTILTHTHTLITAAERCALQTTLGLTHSSLCFFQGLSVFSAELHSTGAKCP